MRPETPSRDSYQGKNKIRNPNIEIRNKFEYQMDK